MSLAIILMNLGSPDSTEVKDVRRYLSEFLMDERVIDTPKWIRTLLVKGIIVPFRSPKSAAAYRKIWTSEGSPLIHITEELTNQLAVAIQKPVFMAMRYGAHKPEIAFDEIEKLQSIDRVLLVPLYPHYAMSSYETAVELAKEQFNLKSYSFKLDCLKPFYQESRYISALSSSIKDRLPDSYDKIIFSYHGIPKRHILKSDCTSSHCFSSEDCCQSASKAHKFCYRHQCTMTTQCLVKSLDLDYDKYEQTYQSRLGRDEWLMPFTAERLTELPGEGVKNLVVVCPAFVSDCLETLEEMAMEGKEEFLHHGGESFTLIPCMNTDEAWVDCLASYVNDIDENNPEMIFDINQGLNV